MREAPTDDLGLTDAAPMDDLGLTGGVRGVATSVDRARAAVMSAGHAPEGGLPIKGGVRHLGPDTFPIAGLRKPPNATCGSMTARSRMVRAAAGPIGLGGLPVARPPGRLG